MLLVFALHEPIEIVLGISENTFADLSHAHRLRENQKVQDNG